MLLLAGFFDVATTEHREQLFFSRARSFAGKRVGKSVVVTLQPMYKRDKTRCVFLVGLINFQVAKFLIIGSF